MPFIIIGIAIAAALGGGTAALSQNSLPGDALWGFKVNVTENVQGALSAGTEAKANWDIGAIKARLSETQALAAKGQLNANTEAKIDANLSAHTKAVADEIAKLRADGDSAAAADVAARYQATVDAQVGPLAQIQATAGADAQASISPIVAKVRAALDQASALSAQATSDTSASASADGSSTGSAGTSGSGTTSANGSVKADVNTKVNVGL